jgi:hypothetical protein
MEIANEVLQWLVLFAFFRWHADEYEWRKDFVTRLNRML